MLVHGFGYDPNSPNRDNPDVYTFPRWEEIVGKDTYRYGWYSVPFGFLSLLGAWMNKRWNRYRYAWDLAEKESAMFRETMFSLGSKEKVNILCHSLGSRLVLNSLDDDADLSMYVGKVLILGGADSARHARKVGKKQPNIEFYSTVVPEDDVLHKLGRFAPGFTGKILGQAGIATPLPNWTPLPLDNVIWRTMMEKKHGWYEMSGDNPAKVADHWYVFENEHNWPLYRSILAGSF
jgi:hypothetical protein